MPAAFSITCMNKLMKRRIENAIRTDFFEVVAEWLGLIELFSEEGLCVWGWTRIVCLEICGWNLSLTHFCTNLEEKNVINRRKNKIKILWSLNIPSGFWMSVNFLRLLALHPRGGLDILSNPEPLRSLRPVPKHLNKFNQRIIIENADFAL